jgi:hypothetical protein
MSINLEKKIVTGYLVYSKIAQPDNKYEAEGKEYSVSILLNEDDAEIWEENFPKQPAKKIKVSQFQEKLRFDTPEIFEDEKNVYQVTLKQDQKEDLELDKKYRPRIFVESVEDGSKVRTDITESRLVANGSYGKVSYRTLENKFGNFAYLQNILISEDNFIEYTAARGKAGSEFDDDDTPVVVKKEAANKAATEARPEKPKAENKPEAPAPKPARTTVKKVKVEEDNTDDADVPF